MRAKFGAVVGMVVLTMVGAAAHQAGAQPTEPKGGVSAGHGTLIGPGKSHKRLVLGKKGRRHYAARRARLAKAAARQAHVSAVDKPFYLPMTRPGMSGRYDIAGWHGAKPSQLDAKRADTGAIRRAARRIARAERPANLHPVARVTFHPLPDKAGWYNPATRPGMVRRYDINGHHRTGGGT